MKSGKEFNLKSCGENVFISEKASIYRPENISIGDNVRIDDFAVLSAGNEGITIGSNVHIGSHCSLIGKAEIILEDYVSVSSGTRIYSSSDNFSGEYLAGATIDEKLRNIRSEKVKICKYSTVGAACVILPDVTIGENTAVGAMSFVSKSLPSDSIYAGIPAKLLGQRIKRIV